MRLETGIDGGLRDRHLLGESIRKPRFRSGNTARQVHTDGARTSNVTERSQQRVGASVAEGLPLHRVVVDCASLGIDDRAVS